MPYANINNINLYYETTGQGTPMVFLHGFKLDHRVMQLISVNFEKRYRTILLDLRGHGLSGKPRGKCGYRNLLSDIKEFLLLSGINKVILVGYSMGGELALQFAVDHPDNVAGLVLIATGFRYGPAANESNGGTKGNIENDAILKKKYEQVIAPAKKLIPKHVEHELSRELNGFDFRGRASLIKAPVLILAGDADNYYPKPIQYEMKDALRRSELSIIENCGHEIVFGRTAESVKIIDEFLIKYDL